MLEITLSLRNIQEISAGQTTEGIEICLTLKTGIYSNANKVFYMNQLFDLKSRRYTRIKITPLY